MTWRQAVEEDPEMFAGCSHIFLDVGSNRGTHVRKLFEPQKYPKYPECEYPNCAYLDVFDEAFGPAESRTRRSVETGICAFGFEANPRWTSTLQQIEKAYAFKGWRARWFAPAAVGATPGSITFWNNDGGENSDWGFSVKKNALNASRIDVDKVDLPGFLEFLNGTASPGFRLMKMDIEAAEYIVLPPCLRKQLLCKNVLDMVTVEWHRDMLGQRQQQMTDRFVKRLSTGGSCPSGPSTKFSTVDDESYLEDGAPLDREGLGKRNDFSL